MSLLLALTAGGTSGIVGLATETDSAIVVGGTKIASASAADETDSALAVPGIKASAYGLSSETDTSIALGGAKASAVALAEEADEAFALASSKAASVGLAVETDEAFALPNDAVVVTTDWRPASDGGDGAAIVIPFSARDRRMSALDRDDMELVEILSTLVAVGVLHEAR